MTIVRVLTANLYVGNAYDQKCINKIKDLNPHGASLQEASNVIGMLEDQLGGYRFSYNKTHKQGKGTPTIVKKDMDESYGTGNLQGCSEIPDTQCGKDRWLSYAVTRFPGHNSRRVMIGTHFCCGVQNDDGTFRSNNMGDHYKTHSDRLCELIGAFKGIGWSPLVAADFNYRLKGKVDTAAEAPDWSPYGIARRFDLKYVAQGIDGILYDPKAFELDRTQRIEQAETGSDHDWLMAHLGVK